MKYLLSLFFVVALGLGAAMALAADDHQMPMGQAAGSAQAQKDFNREYLRAMDNMHGPMMEGVMAADPDEAFVKGMLPHHRGAVEMAEIQLKYGRDPELRKLAQDIISAQDQEIEFMEKWLKEKKPSE